MTSLFESTSDGIRIVLNRAGLSARVADGSSQTFDDVMGARVKIEKASNRLRCEATVPESAEPFLWEYNVGENSISPHRVPLVSKGARDLNSLISELRMALNGRL